METELKFQVPPAQSAALRKAVATATARTTRLQAVYADTADHRLAQAGLALRLRKEGRVWVQALKGRVDGAQGLAQRLEHEVPLGSTEPTLDARRHAGSAVGEQLLALLADGAPLVPLYRTDIRRLHRQLRHAGAVVELAYDRGVIVAGDRKLAVDEVEFELLRGPAAALPAVAARWVQRFGLWWDLRTKSERGFRLALGLDAVPARHAQAVRYGADAGTGAILAATAAGALQQALANGCEIASGLATPEHLHQLRVGLRRLRSLLRVLGPWCGDAEGAAALQAAWREPFAQLGVRRDADVLREQWWPQLQAAGAPPLVPPALQGSGDEDAAVVRSAAYNTLLLHTLALVQAAAVAPSAGPPGAAAAERLGPLLKHARRAGERFDAMDSEARHALRKRLKRLRYVLEALLPLLKPRPAARVLKGLRRALQTLGELNDLASAEAAFLAQTAQDPRAWFAVGWLRARHAALLPQARRDLLALKQLKPRWI